MKKSMLIVLAATVAVSLAACSSVAQEPLSNLEPLASGEPIVSSEPTASEPVRTGELSYSDLTDEHKTLFDEIAPMLDEPVKLGNMSAEDASKELDNLISNLAATGELPTNAVDLFHQYRDEMGITFPEPEPQPEVVLNEGTTSQLVQNQEQDQQQQDGSGDTHTDSAQQIQQQSPNTITFADGHVREAGPDGIFRFTQEELDEIDISAGGDGHGSGIDWSLWD